MLRQRDGRRGPGAVLTPGRATLAGCIALGLWAFLALLSRWAQPAPPLGLAAAGLLVGGIAGVGILVLRGQLGRLRAPAWAWLHGVAGIGGYHALYFAALAWAPPVTANLLNYSWPLLTVLLAAPLRGLRLGPRHLGGVLLGAAGVALLLGEAASGGPAGPRTTLGLLCAAGAALTWALYSVLAARFVAVPAEAVFGFCIVAGLLLGAAHLVLEPASAPVLDAWPAVLLLGLGPMGAAFWLWDFGMKRGDPRLLGTLAYAIPVVSTLLLVAQGEGRLTPAVVGATVLVVAGGALAATAARSTARP